MRIFGGSPEERDEEKNATASVEGVESSKEGAEVAEILEVAARLEELLQVASGNEDELALRLKIARGKVDPMEVDEKSAA